jgi:hypothetical protein
MPSIINATTTNGVTVQGDNSGSLQLATNNGTTAVTISTAQNATFAQTANLPNTFGFKNRIINGDMTIDQRNNGAAVTTSALQQLIFTVDRWGYYNDVVSKRTIQQSSVAPAGFTNSLLVTIISTDTVGPQQFIRQAIEGFNIADLGWGTANAKTVTLSFWVRSSVTGQMGGSVQNSGANRSYPFAYTINNANTWEQKTVVITGPTDGTWLTTSGVGLQLLFENGPGFNANAAGAWVNTNSSTSTGSVNLCATNGATWYLTGVQLEVGSVATSFDYLPIGTELMLCQRYYLELGRSLVGRTEGTTVATMVSSPPVQLRTSPSLNLITATDAITIPGIASYTVSSIAAQSSNANGIYVSFFASGLNNPTVIVGNVPRVIGVSAEL